VAHVAVSGEDEVLLTSEPASSFEHQSDASLAVATPAGISRTLSFTGPGHQQIQGVAVTPDGFAWLQITSYADPDLEVPPVMHVGDLTFTDPGTYLFKLVP
jgi:hypothetical protein